MRSGGLPNVGWPERTGWPWGRPEPGCGPPSDRPSFRDEDTGPVREGDAGSAAERPVQEDRSGRRERGHPTIVDLAPDTTGTSPWKMGKSLDRMSVPQIAPILAWKPQDVPFTPDTLSPSRDSAGPELGIQSTTAGSATDGRVGNAEKHPRLPRVRRDLRMSPFPVLRSPSRRDCRNVSVPRLRTEGVRRLFSGDQADRLQKMVPTRRLGTIDNIVSLALFVLSEAASNINGAIIVSDGGLSLTGRLGIEP